MQTLSKILRVILKIYLEKEYSNLSSLFSVLSLVEDLFGLEFMPRFRTDADMTYEMVYVIL